MLNPVGMKEGDFVAATARIAMIREHGNLKVSATAITMII